MKLLNGKSFSGNIFILHLMIIATKLSQVLLNWTQWTCDSCSIFVARPTSCGPTKFSEGSPLFKVARAGIENRGSHTKSSNFHEIDFGGADHKGNTPQDLTRHKVHSRNGYTHSNSVVIAIVVVACIKP